jgi:hypothetical protein
MESQLPSPPHARDPLIPVVDHFFEVSSDFGVCRVLNDRLNQPVSGQARKSGDGPDDAGIVVTRTVPKRLRSVADGYRPDNGHGGKNCPVANDEAEGQAEEEPGEAEDDARPDQLHGI